MADEWVDRSPDAEEDKSRQPAVRKAAEPSPLLGVSRASSGQMPLWAVIKTWFRGAPLRRMAVNLPRPPRSVLAARTPTIVESEAARGTKRPSAKWEAPYKRD